MMAPLLDHDTVLEIVRRWPRDAQLALAQEILRAAVTPREQEMTATPTTTAPRGRQTCHGM